MATALEGCTIEDHHFGLHLYGQKGSLQRIFMNKCFMFTVGSVCRVKRSTFRRRNIAYDGEVEMKARKRLRQESKDFYAAGFDALVKLWDKCIKDGGGYVKKYE
jgi:hypothetical protein